MKKTFLVKFLACLMAACLVFAGCSAKKTNEVGNSTAGVENEPVVQAVNDVFKKSDSGLFGKAFNALSEKSEKLYDFDYDNLSFDADVKITLGEAFGEFADLVSGSDVSSVIDELGITSAKISADFDRNGDVYSLGADAYINDEFVVNADAVFDYDGEMLYIALPEIVKDFLGVDATEVVDTIEYEIGDFLALYGSQIDAQKELAEGLEKHLSDDEILAILEDYAETGVAELGEPKTKNAEIAVDSVKQDVKAYVYEIDAEAAKKVSKAVLEKLYDDKEIKEKFLAVYPLIFNYYDVVTNGQFSIYADDDAEALYDKFLSNVEDVLDDLEDFDGDGVVTVTCYFADDAFAGFCVENSEDDFVIDFYSVRNGNDVAACFCVDDGYGETSFKLVGNDNGSMYNGVLTITTVEGEIASIKIEDFDLKKFAEGDLSMTLALYAEDMPSIFGGMPEGLAFKLGLDSDNLTYSNFCFKLENDGECVIDIDFDLSYSDDADKISVPADYIDVEDEEAAYNWLMSLMSGVNKVVENLAGAGVSEEAIELIVSNLY